MFQKVSHNSGENHVSPIIIYYQQTDICLPKGQCIEGSGLNSCPSHSIVFLNRLFHSHKSSLHPGTRCQEQVLTNCWRNPTRCWVVTCNRLTSHAGEASGATHSHFIQALINPLHTNISMHFLHSVSYMFPKVLTRRTCQTIQGFCSF